MSIIYLDAGHGGAQTGASTVYGGKTYYEKDFNLKIILRVRDFLKTVKPLPAIYLWRDTDVNGNLYTRGQDAKSKNSDVFVSVHNNSGVSGASGTETLYPKDFTPGHEVGQQFASSIQATFIGYMNSRGWGIVNRGITIWTNSTAELGVFQGAAPIPSCLIEVAFLSSQSDMQKLLNPDFIDDSAYAIALGIVKWLNSHNNAGLSDPLREPIPAPLEEKSLNIAGILIPAILIGGVAFIAYYFFVRRK